MVARSDDTLQTSDAGTAEQSAADLERAEALALQLEVVRGASRRLVEPLSAEDCQPQSMPDASPVKWHLAHTTWFLETFVLEPALDGFIPFHPDYRVIFNSYYQTVGAQHPRPQRGLLTRPSLEDVWRYREHVERRVADLLRGGGIDETLCDVVELGLHHEQQHQELILTDIKHLFAQSDLRVAYDGAAAAPSRQAVADLAWRTFNGGTVRIGHDGNGFAFDNETPRHRMIVEPYALATRLITNGEYLEFMRDGGYETPSLWLSDGWATIQQQGWSAPLYWSRESAGWQLFTLGGMRELRGDEPVTHISFYEADAFATWAGARLPGEAEWELAAGGQLKGGNFAESRLFHPRPASPADRRELSQMFGDVWEWTRSPYTPYPGYRPATGALGEYNGKFMANQMVLRGGSCATPRSHIRATYRNFFPPDARWQFSGLRLARDS